MCYVSTEDILVTFIFLKQSFCKQVRVGLVLPQYFFREKKNGALNIYSNFSKIFIESISHFRRIRTPFILFAVLTAIKDFCILCILIELSLFYKSILI